MADGKVSSQNKTELTQKKTILNNNKNNNKSNPRTF